MCEDSDQEMSDLDMQLRTWRKLENNMKLIGFLEGAAEGKNLSLQEGFDLGYSDGFNLGEYIGMCKGIMRGESQMRLSQNKKYDFDEVTLDNMTNEACVLCSQKKKSNATFTEKIPPENAEELKSTQQCHNNEIIKTLGTLDLNSFEKRTLNDN